MMNNLLLDQLSPADFKLLEPHLKPVHFKQHYVLFEADTEIRNVYFLRQASLSHWWSPSQPGRWSKPRW